MITHKMLNKKFHGDTPTKPHRSGDSTLSWGGLTLDPEPSAPGPRARTPQQVGEH